MQNKQGIEPLPPLRNAKQRRLSRPNIKEEIRLIKKRRKQRIPREVHAKKGKKNEANEGPF